MTHVEDIRDQVYAVTKKIPAGKVTTYGAIARALRLPRHQRLIARALSWNTNKDVPCHRVVCVNGFVGGYNGPGGTAEKANKLRSEGVPVDVTHFIKPLNDFLARL